MAFWTLYKREMRSIFVSPVAYVVLVGCALAVSAGFVAVLAAMTENNVKGYSIVAAMLGSFIFWIPFMIQIPFISMRTFSEEYKMGTIEMLLTAPVREWEVVLSKFAAIVSLFVLLWVPLALDIVYIYAFSNQKFDLTWGMALLPFGLVILLGMFFISICLLASSLTKNQVIAAILGFAFIFLVFCLNFLTYFDHSGGTRDLAAYVGCLGHMDTACRGILDTRPVVFYLSGTIFFLFLTQRVLESRRLRA